MLTTEQDQAIRYMINTGHWDHEALLASALVLLTEYDKLQHEFNLTVEALGISNNTHGQERLQFEEARRYIAELRAHFGPGHTPTICEVVDRKLSWEVEEVDT